jgi:opacity protein-like surface antigen
MRYGQILTSLFTFFSLSLLTLGVAQAQVPNLPSLQGTLGFGVSEYKIHNPASDFTMDDGIFATLHIERPLGIWGFMFTFGVNYMSSEGRTNYDYSTLSQQYTATDIPFASTAFQLGLGMKLRLFPGFFSPYIEGGGLFGYHAIEYKDTAQLQIQGDGFKTKDAITELGHYVEAGLEVAFSQMFGVRAAYRMMQMETRAVDTLGGQKIRYDSNVLLVGFLVSF